MLAVDHLLSRFGGLREKTLIYHVNQSVEISMRIAWTGPIECVGDMQRAQSMLNDSDSKSDQQYLLRVKSGIVDVLDSFRRLLSAQTCLDFLLPSPPFSAILMQDRPRHPN